MGDVLGYKIALQADFDGFDSHILHHVGASYNGSISDFDSLGIGSIPLAPSTFILIRCLVSVVTRKAVNFESKGSIPLHLTILFLCRRACRRTASFSPLVG